jgi:hypothetical protein
VPPALPALANFNRYLRALFLFRTNKNPRVADSDLFVVLAGFNRYHLVPFYR